MSAYLRYFLLISFFSAIFLIVFLQFNSNKNIDDFIDSNDELLAELSLKDNFQKLRTNLANRENKIRGVVIRTDKIPDAELKADSIETIKLLANIDELKTDSFMTPLIADLRSLVNEKLAASNEILQAYEHFGKAAAEKIIIQSNNNKLTGFFNTKVTQLDSLHEKKVLTIINSADKKGREAKVMGTIMGLIASVVSIFTFIFIIYKVREQASLINRLHKSEKEATRSAVVKENFLANMSHEIRTPVNAIIGFTHILKRRNLDDGSKKIVETIHRSGESLLTIVNDILDISKIEAGMMRIEAAPFVPRDVLRTVDALFLQKANNKGLNFKTEITADVPEVLIGDATRLLQVIVNLTANAIKFTNEGQITVVLKSLKVIDDNMQLGITVTDTGIGIAPDKMADIFKRFQQAEDSVTRKYGGTGLGLTIVKDLVQLQNGIINVESNGGYGTTFNVMLPYGIAYNEAAVPGNNLLQQTKNSETNKALKILVAEDNEANQSLIQYLLQEWGCEVHIVSNGEEAIAQLKQQSFDIILMDVQMPVKDGYSTVQEIRNVLKLAIPVIAMTAHAMPGQREKCLASGMTDYIAKPIDEDKLRSMLNTIVTSNVASGQKIKTAVPLPHYTYINLHYMKEVSNGNIEYERLVTGQFLKLAPLNLASIRNAFDNAEYAQMRAAAHNMKTTVSIMGLNEQMSSFLDFFEYEEISEALFIKNYNGLEKILKQALSEAKDFLSTLS